MVQKVELEQQIESELRVTVGRLRLPLRGPIKNQLIETTRDVIANVFSSSRESGQFCLSHSVFSQSHLFDFSFTTETHQVYGQALVSVFNSRNVRKVRVEKAQVFEETLTIE